MPWWNQPYDNLDERFERAVKMVGEEFSEKVLYTGLSWLPARSIVEYVVKNRFQVDGSGQILLFDQFVPWKSHLHDVEERMGLNVSHNIGIEPSPPILYALYEDNQQWRIQCVPLREGSFESRKSLPASWRGLRDEVLSKESNIPDCVFVHATGFIGGNKTKEGALAMARKALKS